MASPMKEIGKSLKKRKLPKWMENSSKKETNIKLEDDLDYMRYTGSIHYCHNSAEASLLSVEVIADLQSGLQDGLSASCAVGFDMEWPVRYVRGKQGKTAVIQISPNLQNCYIFHISNMQEIPVGLKKLLNTHNIKKVGVGVESDLWKLERDFDFKVREIIRCGMVDLSLLGNQVLSTNENWSLDSLVRHLFHKRLDKEPTLRKGQWDDWPMTDAMRQYAATDAYASLIVYNELQRRFEARC